MIWMDPRPKTIPRITPLGFYYLVSLFAQLVSLRFRSIAGVNLDAGHVDAAFIAELPYKAPEALRPRLLDHSPRSVRHNKEGAAFDDLPGIGTGEKSISVVPEWGLPDVLGSGSAPWDDVIDLVLVRGGYLEADFFPRAVDDAYSYRPYRELRTRARSDGCYESDLRRYQQNFID